MKMTMKEMKLIGRLSLVAVVALCLQTTGCVSRRIAWSPDGAHAAIFAGDGLHLCGADGALSEVVLPGEGLAQWFPDSHRLAVVSDVENQSWKDLDKVLAPEERERVVEGAKALLDQFKAGRNLADALSALAGLRDNEKAAAVVYLAQNEGTKEQAGADWDELRQKTASIVQIRIGRLEEGKLALGPPLVNSLRSIADIRIAPTGAAIAFTSEGDKKDEGRLLVVPVDGSAPPQLVAKNTAYGSDWSADGHALVYIRDVNEAIGDDQIGLASLTRRSILNTAGKIEIQTKADDLAGLLFDVNNQVRCLSDGRIVFSSADLHLPCTALDMPQKPQLFALDPERQTAVIPLIPRSAQESLPAKPEFYETSPDGKRVAILADKGAVVVLTLATGALDIVQAAGSDDSVSAPAWRSAGELCFIATTKGQPAQVALWSNGTTRVLSANWPAEARTKFLDK